MRKQPSQKIFHTKVTKHVRHERGLANRRICEFGFDPKGRKGHLGDPTFTPSPVVVVVPDPAEFHGEGDLVARHTESEVLLLSPLHSSLALFPAVLFDNDKAKR